MSQKLTIDINVNGSGDRERSYGARQDASAPQNNAAIVGAGFNAVPNRTLQGSKSKISNSLLDNILGDGYDYTMTDESTYREYRKSGFFRDKLRATVENDGDILSSNEMNYSIGAGIKKVGGASAMLAARGVVDVSISHAKYISGNASYNHSLDQKMRVANYATSAGIALATGNPVIIGMTLVGIAGSEIVSNINSHREYNYDNRMAVKRQSSVRAAVGNLTYGRNRGD